MEKGVTKMKKLSLLALVPVLFLMGCKKEIFSRIIVAKEFQLNNRVEKGGWFSDDKYEMQTVPAGNWKGSLKFEDDKHVWLLIEDGVSKKIAPFVLTPELKKAFNGERYDGTYWLYARESGQPVDVKIEINTKISLGERQWTREYCTYQVPYQVKVCHTNNNGHQQCHWETHYQTVNGEREVQYHMRYVDKEILTTYLSAGQDANAATMDLQDHEESRITDYTGRCFGHGAAYNYGPHYRRNNNY